LVAVGEFLVPAPGARDDGAQVFELGFPAELAFDFFGGGDKTGRIAGAARLFDHRDFFSGHCAANVDDFAHACAAASAKVVKRALLDAERENVSAGKIEEGKTFFSTRPYCKEVVAVSALKKAHLSTLMDTILQRLPEGAPFFEGDDLTDLPVKFFVGEMIREKIFHQYGDEIPYQTTVLVQEFKEKSTLTKIRADIIVQRESQKGIILGEGGKMIRKLGTDARKDIEAFLDGKVFLELFVKVRPKWRDTDVYLKEYGY